MKHELAAGMAREYPIEERRPDVADVRDARWAGCITRADGHLPRIVPAPAAMSVTAFAPLRAILPAWPLPAGSTTKLSPRS